MASGVIGIIFIENRTKVLILKRQDVPVWVLPGGGIDQGETPEIAVIREIEEETGLKVTVIKKVAEYTPINRLAEYTEVFECHIVEGLLQIGTETNEIGFFPLNQLPKSFFLIHKAWLQDTLRNLPYMIQRPLNEVTYLSLFKYFLKHPMHVIKFIKTRLFMKIK